MLRYQRSYSSLSNWWFCTGWDRGRAVKFTRVTGEAITVICLWKVQGLFPTKETPCGKVHHGDFCEWTWRFIFFAFRIFRIGTFEIFVGNSGVKTANKFGIKGSQNPGNGLGVFLSSCLQPWPPVFPIPVMSQIPEGSISPCMCWLLWLCQLIWLLSPLCQI